MLEFNRTSKLIEKLYEKIQRQKEYIEQLKKRDKRLTALENAGVDNWEGYDAATHPVGSEKEEKS